MSKNITINAVILMVFGINLQGKWQTAKYANAFLMNPMGSRAAAMGSAFTAVAGDVSTIYWNPAGLVNTTFTELTAMHSERFAGMVSLDFIAGSVHLHDKASLGIGYFRLGTDDIPKTRLENMNQPLSPENRAYIEKYLQDQESTLFFTYSKVSDSCFNWGTTIKILQKSMGDYHAWGLGFDGGILYFPRKSLRLGASLMNATGTMLAWQDGLKEYILPQLNVGIAYSVIYKQYTIFPTIDIVNLFYKDPDARFRLGSWSPHLHAGIEVDYIKHLALRAGFYRGQLTAGAGLRMTYFQVDYCFSKHSDLGNSHLISLTLQKPRILHSQ